jgi:hypothetical protein
MFEGKYDIKYFLQSRTLKLKESYKDWTKIAHVYLAEKIAERDGSKPESGNRIEFAVVKRDNPDNKKLLQGDMIETTEYIKKNNIPIDYMFYMENQIMKPALQFLKLVDKNAEDMFNKIKAKYGKAKIIKAKKETIPKPKKESKKESIKVTENDLSLKKIIKKTKNKIIDSDTSEQTDSETLINTINVEPLSIELKNNEPVIEVVKKSKKIIEEPVIEVVKKSKKVIEEPVIEVVNDKVIEEPVIKVVKKSKKIDILV